MYKLHHQAAEKFQWYKSWHERRHTELIHWVLLLLVIILFTFGLLSLGKFQVFEDVRSQELDTISPSAPSNLVATVTSPYIVDLSWTGSTDNVALKGYDVMRTNTYCASWRYYTRIAVTSETTYHDYVDQNSCYEYYIRAVDTSGNVSANSNTVSVYTPKAPRKSTPPPTPTPTPITNPDITAPTVPTALSASALDYNSVLVSWRGSTDDYGIMRYKIYIGDNTLSSYAINANYLLDETSYTYSYLVDQIPLATRDYRITALDEAGNESEKSNSVSATTPGREGYGSMTGTVYSNLGGVIAGSGLTGGATVTVSKGSFKKTGGTGPDGSYYIDSVPVDTYTVVVSSSGYASERSEVTIQNKTVITADFTLTKR
ncbi:carboxypeptidase regulatory-like domain-containing protein [Candidatus Daviesbacteria bacterium]|nr:carboxypeptidase regulatory-like domain-containing protein [Candidatus Daviesbacteria bacterium]